MKAKTLYKGKEGKMDEVKELGHGRGERAWDFQGCDAMIKKEVRKEWRCEPRVRKKVWLKSRSRHCMKEAI